MLEMPFSGGPVVPLHPSRARWASPPKLVLLNNALLCATHPNGVPDPSDEPERFGFWVENACLAFAINQGEQVWYWREEPLEIDAVFDGSWGKWEEGSPRQVTSSVIASRISQDKGQRGLKPLIPAVIVGTTEVVP